MRFVTGDLQLSSSSISQYSEELPLPTTVMSVTCNPRIQQEYINIYQDKDIYLLTLGIGSKYIFCNTHLYFCRKSPLPHKYLANSLYGSNVSPKAGKRQQSGVPPLFCNTLQMIVLYRLAMHFDVHTISTYLEHTWILVSRRTCSALAPSTFIFNSSSLDSPLEIIIRSMKIGLEFRSRNFNYELRKFQVTTTLFI